MDSPQLQVNPVELSLLTAHLLHLVFLDDVHRHAGAHCGVLEGGRLEPWRGDEARRGDQESWGRGKEVRRL